MKTTVFAWLLMGAFCSGAYADEAKPKVDCNKMPHNYSISYLDENSDGVISLQEYLQGDPSNQKKTFEHIDANQDGVLDQAEQKRIEDVYKRIHEQAASGQKT